MRLNIPAGLAVRFEPGEEKEVTLTPLAGQRIGAGNPDDRSLAGPARPHVGISDSPEAAHGQRRGAGGPG